MATLIHETALVQDPDRVRALESWRVATKGTPITPNDTLIVGWNYRHKAAESIHEKMHFPIVAWRPEGSTEPHGIVKREVSVTEGERCIALTSLRKRVYDNGSRLWYTMPARWPGRVWFKLSEVRHWQHGRYGFLLDQSYVRPEDSLPYLRSNWNKIRGTVSMGNGRWLPKYAVDDNGDPRVTLRQCLELMPHEGTSVMGTVAEFPFEMVPRSYLLWLVTDGTYTYKRMVAVDGHDNKYVPKIIEGQMNTARDTIGNSLRQSILYYLDSTKLLTRRESGELVFEEDCQPRGSFRSEPEVTRAVRKQKESMDFQPRDLEGRDFCTFGYWDVDDFVACGTSSKVRFESHGTPVWIEAEGRGDSDAMPAHVQNGLAEWERKEKWQPVEKINLGWRPPRNRNGQVLTPPSLEKAYERLFANHQRLERWNQSMDWFCREFPRCRSDRDYQSLMADYDEHQHLLDQIEVEYKAIYAGWRMHIPREWGMRHALEEARKRKAYDDVTKEQELGALLEQVISTESRVGLKRTILKQMIAVSWKARKIRKEREQREKEARERLSVIRDSVPAIGWDGLKELRVPKEASKSFRNTLLFAKTQNPNSTNQRRRILA